MKAYKLITCIDDEGRHSRTVGIFLNRDDALKLFDNGAVYGFSDPKYCLFEIEVFEDLISFVADYTDFSKKQIAALIGDDKTAEVLRTRALNKLTPEERAALGV